MYVQKKTKQKEEKRLTCVLFLWDHRCRRDVNSFAFFFLKMGEQQVTANQIRKSILFFFVDMNRKKEHHIGLWVIEVHSNLFTQIEYAHL